MRLRRGTYTSSCDGRLLVSANDSLRSRLFTPSSASHPNLPSEPLLQLNCLVLGDDPSHIFEIKMQRTESVSALREAVKEKKSSWDGVDADSLVLWKVSITVDQSLDKKLGELHLVDEGSLSPVVKLLKVFTDAPEEEHLHIVVKRPPGECKRLLTMADLTTLFQNAALN
jgi:hypothetical protein